MNSSIQKDYYAEQGTGGRKGPRAAVGGGGGVGGAFLYASNTLQGGEVNRLIPSPPHSNH